MRWNSPINGKCRIVEPDAAITFGGIEIRAFVDDLCIVFEREECVQKTLRHQQLFAVFRA